MTSVVEPSAERYDVRTIVGGGVKLSVFTALVVTLFALFSRALGGTAEVFVQSIFIVIGGVVASFLPGLWVRPRSVDTIAWAATVGLLGALGFTVLDSVALRPLGVYDWTWDSIGGGSGFWYIPVWWMGATVLAWLGAWVIAIAARGGNTPNLGAIAGRAVVLTAVLFGILVLTQAAPARPAVVALAFAGGMVLSVPFATLRSRR